MPNSNYTLLLQAQINAASIQEQLTAMAGKYTLAINAAISSVQQAATTAVAGGGVGGVSGGVAPIVAPVAANAINQFNDALKELNPTMTTTDNLAQQVTRATEAQAVGIDRVAKRTISLSSDLTKFKDVTRESSIATKSWVGDLMNAYEKIMLWAVATGTVYGAFKALREGIEYIKDLNKEMTNIQIVTGFTDSQIKNLALSYNRLAGQLGATTIEVAQGTLEWFRQGKTIEEANKLVTQSIMMSKLANMESAAATQYLTSILNGFKLAAEDATLVLDKLVNLDNNYATSVSELATAMQYSSAVAQQSGITFDELASYITVISSTTRMSAETIGQAFPR